MWRSSEHDVFINPSSQDSGIYAEEEQKDSKSQRGSKWLKEMLSRDK